MKPLKRYRVTVWQKDQNVEPPRWSSPVQRELTLREGMLVQILAEALGYGSYWCNISKVVNGRLVTVEVLKRTGK